MAVTPLRYFVDAFQCKDGKPINESPLYSSSDIFKDRDPRLVLMAVTKNHKFADGTVCDISGRLQGAPGFIRINMSIGTIMGQRGHGL